ncbi:MAG: ribosome biogenesis GTPase Der [Myxococcales bacterium]|nr:ribosome biogenesis GTPase Der [Myxococcales bacterium]
MSLPLVAIVGRPNVGKSTLYNKLVGGRPALVHDTPGLTRDRRYGTCDYFGQMFRVVDTGGLDPEAESEVIGAGIHRQAQRAIAEAEAVVFVADGQAGVSPLDAELGRKLRLLNKPLILVVNKIDHPKHDPSMHEFRRLGFPEVIAVSAAHGRGVDELMSRIVEVLQIPAPPPPLSEDERLAQEAAALGEPEDDELDDELDEDLDEDLDDEAGDEAADDEDSEDEAGDDEAGDDEDSEDEAGDDDEDSEDEADSEVAAPARPARGGQERSRAGGRHVVADPAAPLRIAFVGRPNAGKSSLCNRLVGEERSLVHHVAGTTTDPVDSELVLGDRRYILVDTAGIRRKARVEAEIEKISVSMTVGQIERADVVVLLLDAEAGPSEQDARLAGMIEDRGKALILAVNKADLVPQAKKREALTEALRDNFHFLPWAPVVWLSAARGDGVDRLLDKVDQVARQYRRRIGTAELNRFFAEVCESMPPPMWHGKSARVYYLTQGRASPPTFLLWTSNAEGLPPSYRRFISNRLRERYGFGGTPLRVIAKAKSGSDTSPERSRSRAAGASREPRPPRPNERSMPARRKASARPGAPTGASSRGGATTARGSTARAGAKPARPGGGRPTAGRPASKSARPAARGSKSARPGGRAAGGRSRGSKR